MGVPRAVRVGVVCLYAGVGLSLLALAGCLPIIAEECPPEVRHPCLCPVTLSRRGQSYRDVCPEDATVRADAGDAGLDEPPGDDDPLPSALAPEPPAEEPPAEEPPADEPPADEPPADEPPADEPPADEPPADEDAPWPIDPSCPAPGEGRAPCCPTPRAVVESADLELGGHLELDVPPRPASERVPLIAYSWLVGHHPPESVAETVEAVHDLGVTGARDDPTTPRAVFRPDRPGRYAVELVVTDALGWSFPNHPCPDVMGRIDLEVWRADSP